MLRTTRCGELLRLPSLLAVVLWGTALWLPALQRASAEQRLDQAGAQLLLKKYCVRCHNAEKQQGEVDLSQLVPRPTTLAGRQRWQRIVHQLTSEEMPPEAPLPTAAERQALADWLSAGATIDWSQVKYPGRVTIPRLTREEYDHTMRDLLGVDLRPGRTLSADGQGSSGFNTDRDALFLTPALLEKYLSAADGALASLVALRNPQRRTYQAEAMFMTETSEKPRDFGDGFLGYVINRGQMTLYESHRFPAAGRYRFTIRARSTGGPTGARLRINGEPVGDVTVLTTEPELLSVEAFVEPGSRQFTWNIEKPDPAIVRARLAAAAAPAEKQQPEPTQEKPRPIRKLPGNANEIVTEQAMKVSPRYPPADQQPAAVNEAVAKVDQAAYSLQRPYEWLRLLATDGDPNEIVRFKGYIAQRQRTLDQALANLASAAKLTEREVQERYAGANEARLADNARLLAAVKEITPAVAAKRKSPQQAPQEKPGSVAIDWVEIHGPLLPNGAARQEVVFIAQPGEQLTPREAAEQILARFTRRAFRRPVTDAEVARYLELFEKATARGDAFEPAMQLALSAVLVSPHFLYRNEFGPAGDEYRLDDYQLASRLSYFLWMSMPDEELFDLAAQGKLREPAVLDAQVERMLADPKSRAMSEAFLGQWLGIAPLGTSVTPDAEKFPEFTPELAEAMKLEPVLLFERLLKENGSLLELLDGHQTYLNQTLAQHYGIPDVTGPQMRLVQLQDPNRGGLLGMGSVLTATSSPARTSPVIRGTWVLQTLLGETIPDPPADAGTLAADAGETAGKSLREELLLHRRDRSCAVCHDKIDPIGFGLENFDAIGRYRQRAAGKPIDNTGELPGGKAFRGPQELKRLLVAERADELVRNVSAQLLSFALGRELQLYDEPAVMKITAALSRDKQGALTLVKQVVQSYPFQYQSDQPAPE